MTDFREEDRDLAAGSESSAPPRPADWASDANWWRENYSTRPYVSSDRQFDYYEPAYRYGYESANRYRSRGWNDVETDLESGWDTFMGKSKSTWHDIKTAVKDAWNRATGQDDAPERPLETRPLYRE
ncbi:MAG: hypothetical protein ABR543_00220 [Gemmatimonadaceae bacterium]